MAPTWMLHVARSLICEGPCVLDALGLIACTRSLHYCSVIDFLSRHTKTPKEHVFRPSGYSDREGIVAAYDRSF